jgi:hypothetical protein
VHLNPFATHGKVVIEATLNFLAPAWIESNPWNPQKHVIKYIRGLGEKRTWHISQISITLRSPDLARGLELLSHRMDDLLQLLSLFFSLEDSLTPYNATPSG